MLSNALNCSTSQIARLSTAQRLKQTTFPTSHVLGPWTFNFANS
jgi:hypothetical protein